MPFSAPGPSSPSPASRRPGRRGRPRTATASRRPAWSCRGRRGPRSRHCADRCGWAWLSPLTVRGVTIDRRPGRVYGSGSPASGAEAGEGRRLVGRGQRISQRVRGRGPGRQCGGGSPPSGRRHRGPTPWPPRRRPSRCRCGTRGSARAPRRPSGGPWPRSQADSTTCCAGPVTGPGRSRPPARRPAGSRRTGSPAGAGMGGHVHQLGPEMPPGTPRPSPARRAASHSRARPPPPGPPQPRLGAGRPGPPRPPARERRRTGRVPPARCWPRERGPAAAASSAARPRSGRPAAPGQQDHRGVGQVEGA